MRDYQAARQSRVAVEFEGQLVGSTSFYEAERWDWPTASRVQVGALVAVKISRAAR